MSLAGFHTTLYSDTFQCDIVYGTVGAFAADILRHEFEKVDIRGSRRCDAIVVDEIDYMTLDQGTQVPQSSEQRPNASAMVSGCTQKLRGFTVLSFTCS